MRTWVHDVLLDRTTTNRGYFAPAAVRDLLARDEAHGGYSKEIFSLITLELWQRAFLDRKAAVN
jgi:hypothetical protein